jgi:hypothetical protein
LSAEPATIDDPEKIEELETPIISKVENVEGVGKDGLAENVGPKPSSFMMAQNEGRAEIDAQELTAEKLSCSIQDQNAEVVRSGGPEKTGGQPHNQ